ncbi:MAG: flagellar biosynthesis protein FlhF [Gammaproteobacteria bacterium]|nr:flagellar biosynthesis protein FlhF [Gammaproteobacteria bacterium]MBU1443366.1 flagellar biosynthesis protein FlhF [Gammaproteobacteria bacterium]MBU2288144.1 flagellar biosynthesis protein FlhF [Gammaproteobacteria bacterium]
MNIQRFHASTAREALALARATFGDSTLILSNRQLADGVEVVAAAEGDLSSLELTLPPATTAQTPVKVRSAERPAPAALPAAPAPRSPASPLAPSTNTSANPVAARAATSTHDMVQADTEQLSMSTLSFQDYVRERMLRRQNGVPEATAGSASSPAPASSAAFAAAPTRAAPRTLQPSADAAALRARAPAAPLTAPQLPPEPLELPAVDEAPAASTPAALNDWEQPAKLAQPAAQAAPSIDIAKVLMAELSSMKQLMEERFNTLSWLGQARQDPIHSNLMLKLVRAGYSPALARSVLEPIEMRTDANDVVRDVMRSLERMLGIEPDAPSMVEEGGVFALIGATGVGKTTTAAKLAAQCAQVHGAASVGLITLDTHRAGAHEQLRGYGRSLGIVAHLAHDRAALQELLNLLKGKKMVLIDTAGIAPRDPRRREVLDVLDTPTVKRVLVLNAGAHGDTLDDIATSFKIGGTSQAILSKVDEAAKLGPALDTVMRHQLTLRGVTNGQRIPQDWKAANGTDLIRESMRAAQRSAFDPRTADMDFFFSPAACAV